MKLAVRLRCHQSITHSHRQVDPARPRHTSQAHPRPFLLLFQHAFPRLYPPSLLRTLQVVRLRDPRLNRLCHQPTSLTIPRHRLLLTALRVRRQDPARRRLMWPDLQLLCHHLRPLGHRRLFQAWPPRIRRVVQPLFLVWFPRYHRHLKRAVRHHFLRPTGRLRHQLDPRRPPPSLQVLRHPCPRRCLRELPQHLRLHLPHTVQGRLLQCRRHRRLVCLHLLLPLLPATCWIIRLQSLQASRPVHRRRLRQPCRRIKQTLRRLSRHLSRRQLPRRHPRRLQRMFQISRHLIRRCLRR
jgi:hypothetical protein